MSSILAPRWLSAVLLFAALPAAPQANLAFSAGTHADEAEAGSVADIPQVEHPAQLPELSPEELADIYLVRGRYQAAVASYSKVQHPSSLVWNKMGIAYQMLYAYKDAMRCYKQSLRMNSRDARVLNNLATAQDQMQDFKSAESSYRKALKLDPHSAMTLKNLGTNLLMQHKYDKGHQAYQQALKLDSHIFDDHFGPKVNDPAPKNERGTAAYFKAKSCARAGLSDCAITYLRKAMDEGFTIKQVSQESDFEPLRNTAAYSNLMALEQ